MTTKESTKIIVEKFGDICRLCGERGKMDMTYIFDNKLKIYEKISSFIPIIILQFDHLPKKICATCNYHLRIATDLIKKACETDEKLRQCKDKSNDIETLVPNLSIKGPIICDICQTEFKDMKTFDAHLEAHEDTKADKDDLPKKLIQICADCGYAYQESDKYLDHKLLVTSVCKSCGCKLLSNCSRRSHLCQKQKVNVVTEEKRHNVQKITVKKVKLKNIADLVDSTFKSPVKSSPVKQLPKLDQSGKENSSKKGETHLELTPVPETFLQQDIIIMSSSPNKPPWECGYCGKVVTTKVSLKVHERIHSGDKPYICEHCGEGFRSRANLTQHMPIHTGVRKYSCPICSKRFARKSFVRTHIRVHTGEKPYACDLCGNRFTQVGDMRRHRKRHSTQKGFQDEKKEAQGDGQFY